jgi:hypothetical protein
MTALARLRLGEESLETNLLEREPFFHCERFLENWREEEQRDIALGSKRRVEWFRLG